MPHKYWTREDVGAVAKAKDFVELREIAERIIARMDGDVGMVCGPITSGGAGSINKNLAIFRRRIRELTQAGVPIFNQLPFEPKFWELRCLPGTDREDQLLYEFYGYLLRYGLIKRLYFIPGWETSYGARWEHNKARCLSIPINYL